MDEIPSQEHNARPYRIGVVCADKKIKFMPPINPVCQTVKSWLESQF